MIKNSFTAKYTKELKMLYVSFGFAYLYYAGRESAAYYDKGIRVTLYTTHKDKKKAENHPLTCQQHFTYNAMIKHNELAVGLFKEMKSIAAISKLTLGPKKELNWNTD